MARFDSFVFDPARRQLQREGVEVHLTPKAFDLLAILLEAAPSVVSKAELHRRMWPKTFVSDATLVGLIKEVRRALDDHDAEAPFIRTVPRVGYAFARELATGARAAAAAHWLIVDGRRLPLAEGENLIGRDPQAPIWLDFASVSRRHARVVVSRSQATLEDVGSKNGTRVGGERLVGSRELRDGDRLSFGTVEAVFRSSSGGLSTVTHAGWPTGLERLPR
jgi:DNA-binding winged helix-turn-helix (wHTH) protein